tara:strand:+ start:819 stop:1316 length:498 start_codon:yes stop_codon:yes gene_type:complete
MNNKAIEKHLKALKIGDSMSFESTSKSNLKEITDEMNESFKIIKVSGTIYSILRIDESESNAAEKISEAIPRLNWFNQIKINCSPSYARALISKHNTKETDSISVRKSGPGVIIKRNVPNAESLSVDLMTDMISELNYLIRMKEFDETAEGESIVNSDNDNESIM